MRRSVKAPKLKDSRGSIRRHKMKFTSIKHVCQKFVRFRRDEPISPDCVRKLDATNHLATKFLTPIPVWYSWQHAKTTFEQRVEYARVHQCIRECTISLSLSLSLSFPYIRGECSQAKSKQRTQGETREACKLARRSHNTREPRKTTAPAETGARRITSSFVFPLLANGATLKGQTIPWKFTIARENVSCLARSHSFLSVVPTGSQAHLCTGLFCI